MEERIKARLVELQQAEQEAEMRLIVIRNLIMELRGLLQPEPIITQSDEESGE